MITVTVVLSIVCIMLIAALLYVLFLTQTIVDDSRGVIDMLSRENTTHVAKIKELNELLASLPKPEPGAEDPYSIDNVED